MSTRELALALRRRGVGAQVAHTAAYNVGSTIAAGLGGVIIARALGPEVQGEYSAVTAWFGMALMIGGMGQPAALCYYVAHDPGNARGYVATSRAMMLTTGAIVLVGGVLLAPILAHGGTALTRAYRIAFATSIVAFVGASYTFSLQATDLRSWNALRISQPAMSLVFVVALWKWGLLTLTTSVDVLAVTMFLQLVWAHHLCRSAGLVPGRAEPRLVRPLAIYGTAQIAALTPAALNARLDQLILSQATSPATLGRYAVAVSCSLLPMPVVSAIGYVAFPQLAARRGLSSLARQGQWLAVVLSACLAAGVIVPLALAAPWFIPGVFGARYAAAVPLLWVLAPGAVFLACGKVTGDVLRGRDRPTVVAKAQGLAAVFTVILLAGLLPFVGVYGAAIASTVAYGVALVVMILSLRGTLECLRYGS